jgi:hypothetical protein
LPHPDLLPSIQIAAATPSALSLLSTVVSSFLGSSVFFGSSSLGFSSLGFFGLSLSGFSILSLNVLIKFSWSV